MKKLTYSKGLLGLLFILILGTGCATTQSRLLDSDESQVRLRSIQSRAFDTTDKAQTLRTAISLLQDLGFIIDQADLALGTVTGTKLAGYQVRMTVSVRPRGETQLIVRANAQYNLEPVTDPEPYRTFFTALEKAMFLTGHQVD